MRAANSAASSPQRPRTRRSPPTRRRTQRAFASCTRSSCPGAASTRRAARSLSAPVASTLILAACAPRLARLRSRAALRCPLAAHGARAEQQRTGSNVFTDGADVSARCDRCAHSNPSAVEPRLRFARRHPPTRGSGCRYRRRDNAGRRPGAPGPSDTTATLRSVPSAWAARVG